MSTYEARCRVRLAAWERSLLKPPGVVARTSKRIQTRINQVLPAKVHQTLTAVVKGIVQSVQVGLDYAPATPPLTGLSLQDRDVAPDVRLGEVPDRIPGHDRFSQNAPADPRRRRRRRSLGELQPARRARRGCDEQLSASLAHIGMIFLANSSQACTLASLRLVHFPVC